MTSSQASAACHRLSAIGLRGQEKHLILDTINTWVKNSGADWTVSRLKDYKKLYVQKLAGVESNVDSWIATHPNGIPKGPLGLLFKAKSYKKRVRSLNALMVYTGFIRSQVTDADMEKSIASIGQDINYRELRKMVPEGTVKPYLLERSRNQRYVRQYSLKPHEIVLNPEKRSLTSSGESCSELKLNSIDDLFSPLWKVNHLAEYDPLIDKIIDRLPRMLKEIVQQHRLHFGSMPDEDIYNIPLEQTRSAMQGRHYNIFHYNGVPNIVGRIAFLAEPGFKTRVIAIPHRCLQFLLKPLGQALFNKLHKLDADCTFNQQKGVDFAQKSLSEGKTVHCVDLSSATDNFPLEYQLKVLEIHGFPEEDIHLFKKVATGVYKLPKPLSDGIVAVSWTKGQPMGLYPSFGSFALSHHHLLMEIEKSVGVFDTYRILGDDIVISNDKIHELYIQKLELLQVPVSKSKCLSSNRYAEFAGKLVTSNQVFPTFKHRRTSDRNFLDIAKALGRPALGLLSKPQRRALKFVAALPEPWGLGWNSFGLRMEQRIQGRELLFNTDLKTDKVNLTKVCEFDLVLRPDVQTLPMGFFDFVKDLETADRRKEKTFRQYRESLSVNDRQEVSNLPRDRGKGIKSAKLNKLRKKYHMVYRLEKLNPGTNAGLLQEMYNFETDPNLRKEISMVWRDIGYWDKSPEKSGDPRPNVQANLNRVIDEQIQLNLEEGVKPIPANRFEGDFEEEKPTTKRGRKRSRRMNQHRDSGGYEL